MTWTPDLRGLRNVLQRNLLLKVFSLVFAIGLWAFVNLGARDAEKTLVVPVELRNVPPDFVVTSPLVEAIDVRVRGPRTILGTIDEGRLGVRLDLSKARPGTTSFTVDPERLSLPRGLRVTRLSPVDVPLTVERLMTRRVAVKMNPGTVVPEGLRLLEPQIRPETVSVTAPESEVPKLERVITTPLELSAEAGDFERLVAIERPSPLSKVVPERVTVRGRLEEIVASKKYEQVEIGVRNGSGKPSVKPGRADVTLRGPERILEQFRPTEETLFVDLDGLQPGKHERKIQTQLPDGVEVTRMEPDAVSVEIGGEGTRAR